MTREENHVEGKPSRGITVEPLVFFFGAALGSVHTMQAPYIGDRLGQDRNCTSSKVDNVNGTCTTNNADNITQLEIATEMATWTMMNTAVSFLPVVLLAPFYGVLSDHLGRKLTFAIPILAHIVSCIILLLVVYLRLPLPVMVFANLVEGFGGNYCFFLAGCYAYAADISTEQKRLARIARIQAVYFNSAEYVQIPAVFFINTYGLHAPLWLSLALILAALLYVVTPRVLAETVEPEVNRYTLHLGDLPRTLRGLLARNAKVQTTLIVLVLVIYFFTDIIQLSTSAGNIYGIYGLGPPLCWSSDTAGYFAMTLRLTRTIGLVVCSRLFSICLEDYWILQVAFTFGCLSNLMLAFAPTTAVFFTVIVLGCPRSMAGPVFCSILSKIVSPQKQGTIFAIQSSVQSVAAFLSPLILPLLYTASDKTQHNLVLYVIAGVIFILFVLGWLGMLLSKRVITYNEFETNRLLADESP